MNKTFAICILFIVMAVVSCKTPGKQEQIVPEERKLSAETMENIFYEMHLVDAMVSLQMVNVNGHTSLTQYQVDSLLYESIYEKYNCTRESFEESVLWYLQNQNRKLKDIYENVVDRFNLEMTKYNSNKTDSIPKKQENTL